MIKSPTILIVSNSHPKISLQLNVKIIFVHQKITIFSRVSSSCFACSDVLSFCFRQQAQHRLTKETQNILLNDYKRERKMKNETQSKEKKLNATRETQQTMMLMMMI
jgi:Na+-translocating ferredoxin:NAD+ oxidoreductase RnfC subunit